MDNSDIDLDSMQEEAYNSSLEEKWIYDFGKDIKERKKMYRRYMSLNLFNNFINKKSPGNLNWALRREE